MEGATENFCVTKGEIIERNAQTEGTPFECCLQNQDSKLIRLFEMKTRKLSVDKTLLL